MHPSMDFKPIKAKWLYEEMVAQIQELLAAGQLKPGDKLPSEHDLAERFQTSLASVREALSALEMMGIIETRPGDGAFVRGASADAIVRPLAMLLAVEKSSLLEVFEVRRVFETAAVRLAAERATEEEVAHVKAALESMKERLNVCDSEKGEEYDIAFHYAIARATHNGLLIRLYRTISEDFSRAISAARRRLYTGAENPKPALEQHERIYRALKNRDPVVAARCMLEHLIHAERELSAKMS